LRRLLHRTLYHQSNTRYASRQACWSALRAIDD
jgi:hypothetical protein